MRSDDNTVSPQTWMASAICAQTDPEIWFPDHKRDGRVKQAISLCQMCPVISECGRYADEIEADYGVWGGVLRGTIPGYRPQHGTEGGAKWHQRQGEAPCLSCLEAARAARIRRKYSRTAGGAV